MAAIAVFLSELTAEGERRGYRFDATKIVGARVSPQIRETRGQLDYEWKHLRRKLAIRLRRLLGGCEGLLNQMRIRYPVLPREKCVRGRKGPNNALEPT